MQRPASITFRNMDKSAVLETHVHKRIGELEKAHPHIVGCDVVIEAPQKKKVTGTEFAVRLTISVPGPDIHVERHVGRSGAAEDANLAIHEAFDAARRILKEQKRKMGSVEVKHHDPVMHGTIDRLFEGEGYGFITSDDGNEVYFERDSMTNGDWDSLRVGTKLRFREMAGEKGPFAANVAVAD
ncbi:HPF/RaiA family ribosome-associated protein [Oricola nitratireducens]|uniref:HPF/RaiA family ribosome-associated protein n=1 Tax=Oricola nitratireducens TaxID=2775868 RepID=UPI0018682EF8|nr:HPF/RaiA family ribosome-associated protein [Oricola nitratireducens]